MTQHVQKWDLGHLIRIFEWKPVSAYSYNLSAMGRFMQTSRIRHPSFSNSGFDLNVESMWQVPDLALIHAESDELWMIMSPPVLDTSFEHISWSLSTSIEMSQSAKNSREHLE